MLTRIITGVIGIAAAVAIITKGGWVFALAVLLLSAVGWHEYHNMAASKGLNVYYLTSGLGAFLLTAIPAGGYLCRDGGAVHYGLFDHVYGAVLYL